MTRGLLTSAMLNRVSFAHNRVNLVSETATIIEVALDEGLVSWPEAVNIFPRRRRREGNLVGSNSDHRTVFLVKRKHIVRLAAAKEHAAIG